MFTKNNRVLLIDMEEESAYILKRCLRITGKYKIVFAKGAGMGRWLASCPWHKPDLIIMDTLAPCAGTLEALTSLKKSRQTADIPVILVSAVAKEEYPLKEHKFECDDYIVKPLAMKEFLSRMDAVLCK